MLTTKNYLIRALWGLLLLFIIYTSAGFVSAIPISKINTGAMPNTSLLNLSKQLLYNVKTEEPTNDLELALSNKIMNNIIEGLNNDDAIKTFWINMYNAWFQILAVRERSEERR